MAFISAFIFALGLGLGGMTDATKVVGFLDFAGAWDPSLAFVMGGAVATYALGHRFVRRRTAPLLSTQFSWPRAVSVDARLLTGAAIFGVGWGLAGLCPGPALTSIARGTPGILTFVAAMVVGLVVVPSSRPRS